MSEREALEFVLLHDATWYCMAFGASFAVVNALINTLKDHLANKRLQSSEAVKVQAS